MKNTLVWLRFLSLFGLLCLHGFYGMAQYSDIEWSLYFYEKNIKMADSELVENILVTTESNKEYVYIVGRTHSTSNSVQFCNTGLGNGDVFLGKFDANGKTVWIRYLGGSGSAEDTLVSDKYDWGYALACDKAPNGKPRIYVGGTTLKNNNAFVCSDACSQVTYQEEAADGWDGFVAKYDGNGNLMRWTYLGGGEAGRTDTDEVLSLEVFDHKVFVSGYAEGPHSTLLQKEKVSKVYDTTYNGGGDAFIAVFDTCLSDMSFFTYFNVSANLADTMQDPKGQDRIHGMKIGKDGSIYLSGTTNSDAGISTDTTSIRGGNLDQFVGRWIPDETYGYKPQWSMYQGGINRERGRMLALDDDDNVFVTGLTYSDSTSFPTIGHVVQKNNAGDPDAFISKIDASGNIKWRTFFGGFGSDISNGIQTRRSSDGLHQYVAIAGLTKNCDLFTSKQHYPLPVASLNGTLTQDCNPFDTSTLKNDAFVALVTDPDYGIDTIMNISFGTFAGGSKGETYGPSTEFTGYGPTLAFAKNGNMYVAFSSASKDIGDAYHGNAGKIKSKFHGEFDAIVQKYPLNATLKELPRADISAPGEIIAKPSLEIYPLPFDQVFTVKLKEESAGVAELKLFSVTGEFLGDIGLLEEGTMQLNYSSASLSSGVYFLHYADSKKVTVTKLIKQ